MRAHGEFEASFLRGISVRLVKRPRVERTLSLLSKFEFGFVSGSRHFRDESPVGWASPTTELIWWHNFKMVGRARSTARDTRSPRVRETSPPRSGKESGPDQRWPIHRLSLISLRLRSHKIVAVLSRMGLFGAVSEMSKSDADLRRSIRVRSRPLIHGRVSFTKTTRSKVRKRFE